MLGIVGFVVAMIIMMTGMAMMMAAAGMVFDERGAVVAWMMAAAAWSSAMLQADNKTGGAVRLQAARENNHLQLPLPSTGRCLLAQAPPSMFICCLLPLPSTWFLSQMLQKISAACSAPSPRILSISVCARASLRLSLMQVSNNGSCNGTRGLFGTTRPFS